MKQPGSESRYWSFPSRTMWNNSSTPWTHKRPGWHCRRRTLISRRCCAGGRVLTWTRIGRGCAGLDRFSFRLLNRRLAERRGSSCRRILQRAAGSVVWPTDRIPVGRNRVFSADAAVNLGQGLHGAWSNVIVKIHAEQSKFFGVTELPLEIVKQRPIIKAAHIHATIDGAVQGRQVLPQVTLAKSFVGRGRSMLGKVHGQSALTEHFQQGRFQPARVAFQHVVAVNSHARQLFA